MSTTWKHVLYIKTACYLGSQKHALKHLQKQAMISNNQNEKELTLDSLTSSSSIFIVRNELQILCKASLAISFVTLLHNIHSKI